MNPQKRTELLNQLSAFIDGELDERTAAELRRLLEHDAEARRLHHELQRTVELLRQLPPAKAPAYLSEQTLCRLEKSALLSGTEATPTGRATRKINYKNAAGVAAAVLVALLCGWLIHDSLISSKPNFSPAVAPQPSSPSTPTAGGRTALKAAPTPEDHTSERSGELPATKGTTDSAARMRTAKAPQQPQPPRQRLNVLMAQQTPLAIKDKDHAKLLALDVKVAQNRHHLTRMLLQQHNFQAEKLNVTVISPDVKNTARQLRQLCFANNLADASQLDDQTILPGESQVFVEGKQGQNFPANTLGLKERQFLLRGTAEQLSNIILALQDNSRGQLAVQIINPAPAAVIQAIQQSRQPGQKQNRWQFYAAGGGRPGRGAASDESAMNMSTRTRSRTTLLGKGSPWQTDLTAARSSTGRSGRGFEASRTPQESGTQAFIGGGAVQTPSPARRAVVKARPAEPQRKPATAEQILAETIELLSSPRPAAEKASLSGSKPPPQQARNGLISAIRRQTKHIASTQDHLRAVGQRQVVTLILRIVERPTDPAPPTRR